MHRVNLEFPEQKVTKADRARMPLSQRTCYADRKERKEIEVTPDEMAFLAPADRQDLQVRLGCRDWQEIAELKETEASLDRTVCQELKDRKVLQALVVLKA